MSQKGGYTGPLEQIGPCQWRIPKSYRPDMRVDGIIFADDDADRADQEGPGPRAGRERGHAARHPEGQPGHARHPLGLRLLHRRRGGDRPGGGRRDLARRGRLRHQLRRPAAAYEPRLERGEGPDQAAGRPALPRHPHRRRPERQVPLRQAQADPADGAGVGVRGRVRATAPSATWTSPRPRAVSTGPTRRGSATAPSRAATTSAARSARATISSRSRSSTASSTRSRPR